MEGTKKDFQYVEDSSWQAGEMGCDFPGTSGTCHAYSGIINFSEPRGGTVVWQQFCREQSVVLPGHALTVSQWTPRHPSPWGAQMRTQPGTLFPALDWPQQDGSALCFRKNLGGDRAQGRATEMGRALRNMQGKATRTGIEKMKWNLYKAWEGCLKETTMFSTLTWMGPLQEEQLRFNIQTHLY